MVRLFPWVVGLGLLTVGAACSGSDSPGSDGSGAGAGVDGGVAFDGGATTSGGVDDSGASSDAAGSADAGKCAPTSWPTPQTVGIPAGAPALTALNGSPHTKADGEVYDAVDLQGRLYVDHKNVTIRRSKLVGDQYYAIYTTIPDSYLTIEDSEITGGVLLTDHFIGRRNYLHASAGGTKNDGYIFAASHVLLEDNRIDGLAGDVGAHLDGVQVMAGSDITIRHNWIEAVSPPISGGGINAAVFFKPDKGAISDVTVECNMLIEKDGYYPLRIDSGGAVIVRSNRWEKGHLGAPVHIAGATVVSAWEDNSYTDGTVIPKP